MPITNFEKYLDVLKTNYDALAEAYRKGDFEAEVEFSEGEWFSNAIGKLRGSKKRLKFKVAAEKLFVLAQSLYDEYTIEKLDVSLELKEQLAEYTLRAQALSYEIADYFLSTNKDVAKHFGDLAIEVCRSPQAYYMRHYKFVVTPNVKENIIKQIVLSALCGINVIYREYETARYFTGVDCTNDLIDFLERDFPAFCGRETTSLGLLGLAYFLKGRLLLGRVSYKVADECFRLSAEFYINSISTKQRLSEDIQGKHETGKTVISKAIRTERAFKNQTSVEVPLSELLAMRRAALVLALGSGYIGLISSHIKEANNLLVLARGILHLNSPRVYCYYTELLYWATKRAANSNDATILSEAKERITECRKVFNDEVPDSHYPHRASIELSLVHHYLAQLDPVNKSEYYRLAILDLEAAIKFSKINDESHRPNNQLLAEASYILSHILRYKSADLLAQNADRSIELLRSAYTHAKQAEVAAEERFPRHKCEALLALCGIYAEVARRGIELSEIDPKFETGTDPNLMLKTKALEALRKNENVNPRISAICYLRLIDHYLRHPNTYSRAFRSWEEWEKIKDAIEHAFVKEWAERTQAKLNQANERYHVIDFEQSAGIDQLTSEVKASFAKSRIAKWVEDTHTQYKLEAGEGSVKIVKRKVHKRPGRYASLQGGLVSYLQELFTLKNRDAKKLIEDHQLLSYAEGLMQSYLEEE
jgi:hypothetical protein